MARLENLRIAYMPLSFSDKLHFIEVYRTRRYNDLNVVQEFDLSKQKKTKSTKVREKKEPKEKIFKKKINPADYTEEQLGLLKQLGLI